MQSGAFAMRASGPTTTTTMLRRKESNLQPSASEAAALPVAPLPNAGAEGLEPSAHRFKGGRSTVELRPKSNVMDGVRIELTMLASERRGYGPLDHRWSHPVLVRRALELPNARRSPLLFALSENDEEEREAVEAPGGDDVGGNIEPASPGRRPGAQPMGDTRVCTAGRSRTFSSGFWRPVPLPMGLLP